MQSLCKGIPNNLNNFSYSDILLFNTGNWIKEYCMIHSPDIYNIQIFIIARESHATHVRYPLLLFSILILFYFILRPPIQYITVFYRDFAYGGTLSIVCYDTVLNPIDETWTYT
jgi:hypothetical protein